MRCHQQQVLREPLMGLKSAWERGWNGAQASGLVTEPLIPGCVLPRKDELTLGTPSMLPELTDLLGTRLLGSRFLAEVSGGE